MNDMDDPMAMASPMGQSGGYTNGYDAGPSKPWKSPRQQPTSTTGRMLDMSMDDDIIEPISVSMEMTDSRDDLRTQMRPSPVASYQSNPYEQQRPPPLNQQYRQPPPSGYSFDQQPSEPTWEWQYGSVRLDKKPNCGFGLAVIGGVDKPTTSGEVSIIVSDILPNGPADDKLKINDRLLKVNGIIMDNVDHGAAVGALRSAGSSVVIEFRRKVRVTPQLNKSQTLPSYTRPATTNDYYAPAAHQTLPPSNQSSYYTPQGSLSARSLSQPPARRAASQLSLTHSQGGGYANAPRETITLNKSRNEGFGMQLGWKLFVQGMSEYGVAAQQGLSKGDTIVKINNYPIETLSLADAKRIIQTSGNTLDLEIVREPQPPAFSTPAYASHSADHLDRLSIGRGGDDGSYGRPQPQQQQHHQQQQQHPYEVPEQLPLRRAGNEMLNFDPDDPLHSAPPPRPPLPGEERQPQHFSMPPPRPPSPGKQEFMGHSTAL